LLFSLSLVTCAGYFLVQSSVKLASLAGISEWVIGITVVAMATSAPEMVTSLVAVLREKHAISAGNLIGSNLFNVLGVLGLASWIHPLHVENSAYVSMIMLTFLTASVLIFMRTAWRVSRNEGILLIVFNLSVYLFSILF
jgi:cation:H+ antiporter